MKYQFIAFSLVCITLIFTTANGAEKDTEKIIFNDIIKFTSNGKLRVIEEFQRDTPFVLLNEDSTICMAEAITSEVIDEGQPR